MIASGVGEYAAAIGEVISAAISAAIFRATAQNRWKMREAVGVRMNPLTDPCHACTTFGVGVCIESLEREMDHRDDACEGRKPSAAAATQRAAWLASTDSDQLMDGAARQPTTEKRIDVGASERDTRHMGRPR
jgi:hypothetical protein